MKQNPDHSANIISLRRIEGQVRGIQKMIETRQYCVDILTQVHSVIGALYRVESEIFRRHTQGCVANALKGRSALKKQKKIDEIIELISRFRKAP